MSLFTVARLEAPTPSQSAYTKEGHCSVIGVKINASCVCSCEEPIVRPDLASTAWRKSKGRRR